MKRLRSWMYPSSTAVLITMVILAACDISKNEQADTSDTLPRTMQQPVLGKITIDSTTLPADGISSTLVRVSFLATDSTTPRLVIFRTTAGSLGAATSSLDTSNADASQTATTVLRAPRVPGLALVSASAGSDLATASVTFAPALAQSVSIDPSRFSLKGTLDSSLTLTVRLSRVTGLPTAGALVTFAANRLKGNSLADSVGVFGAAAPASDSGLTTVRFSAGPLDTGTVVITASTAGAGSVPVTGKTLIQIVP